MSIAVLSITLDELGFFNYIACKIVRIVKHSQYKLFFALFAIVAILTIFTSNDIVILTFTLFICYFAKKTKINPLPYLIMEFVVANTFSMIFIIGNPTNIYLASAFNIDFISYFKVMWLPTILAGSVSATTLTLLFRKDLNQPFNETTTLDAKIKSVPLLVISLIFLFGTTIMLAISSYVHIEMWLIALVAAASLLIIILVYSLYKHSSEYLAYIIKHVPWSLSVFVISMFVIVLALNEAGIFTNITIFFNSIINGNNYRAIWVYGISSAITDNIINNIPMSLAYSNIITGLTPEIRLAGIYATIIGSNIGAFLTPIGALAGIMWLNILKHQNIKFTFLDFVKYGIILTTIILIAALIGLCIIL